MRAELRSDDDDRASVEPNPGVGDEGVGSLRATSARLHSPAAAWNRTPEPLCCHPPGSLTWHTYRLCCIHMQIQMQMPTVSITVLYIVVMHTLLLFREHKLLWKLKSVSSGDQCYYILDYGLGLSSRWFSGSNLLWLSKFSLLLTANYCCPGDGYSAMRDTGCW